jgi:hypothetical protein
MVIAEKAFSNDLAAGIYGLTARGLRRIKKTGRSGAYRAAAVFSAVPFTRSGCEKSAGFIVKGTFHETERKIHNTSSQRAYSPKPPFTAIH